MNKEAERAVNRTLIAVRGLLPDPTPPVDDRSWLVDPEAPGVIEARRRMGRVWGVSAQSLWRWTFTQTLPGWFYFALLGVALTKGNRDRAQAVLRGVLDGQLELHRVPEQADLLSEIPAVKADDSESSRATNSGEIADNVGTQFGKKTRTSKRQKKSP